MIYEWKCSECNSKVEVERKLDDYNKPPTVNEARKKGCYCDIPDHCWVKVYNSSTPFKTLADKGVFMDQHGNYPPRKLD
tara:strand:- start:10452 stop:10688 length:237 start_codon:yes stop_codon:yes gene_type:complete